MQYSLSQTSFSIFGSVRIFGLYFTFKCTIQRVTVVQNVLKSRLQVIDNVKGVLANRINIVSCAGAALCKVRYLNQCEDTAINTWYLLKGIRDASES